MWALVDILIWLTVLVLWYHCKPFHSMGQWWILYCQRRLLWRCAQVPWSYSLIFFELIILFIIFLIPVSVLWSQNSIQCILDSSHRPQSCNAQRVHHHWSKYQHNNNDRTVRSCGEPVWRFVEPRGIEQFLWATPHPNPMLSGGRGLVIFNLTPCSCRVFFGPKGYIPINSTAGTRKRILKSNLNPHNKEHLFERLFRHEKLEWNKSWCSWQKQKVLLKVKYLPWLKW